MAFIIPLLSGRVCLSHVWIYSVWCIFPLGATVPLSHLQWFNSIFTIITRSLQLTVYFAVQISNGSLLEKVLLLYLRH